MTAPVSGGSGSANFFLNFSTNAGTAAEEMVAGFEPGIATLKSLIELMEQYETAQGRMGHTGKTAAAGGTQSAEIEAAANRLAELQTKITSDLQRTLSGLETVMSKFGAMEQGVVTGVGKATAAVTTLMGDVQGMLDRVAASSEKLEGAARAGTTQGAASTVREGVQQVTLTPGSQPIPVRVVNEPTGRREPERQRPTTATSATDDAAKGRTATTEPVVVPRAGTGAAGKAAATEASVGAAQSALADLNTVLQDLNRSAREATASVEGEAATVRRTGTGKRAGEPVATRGSQNAPANATARPAYVPREEIGVGFGQLDPATQKYLMSMRGKLNNPAALTPFRQNLINQAMERLRSDPAYSSISDPAQLFSRATGIFTPRTAGPSFGADVRRSDRTYLSQNLRSTLQQPISQEAIGSVLAQEEMASARPNPTSLAGTGQSGPGINSLLFGGQGFKTSFQRHAGFAISNSLSYGLVFTGLEKLREVVKDGLDAQVSFVRLQAVLNANGVAAKSLDQSLLNISSQTAQPIEEVVDAASHLAGVLHNASEIEVGTKIAAQLANISQGSLTAEHAAQGLVDLLSAFPDSNLQNVGDQIAQLHNITGVNVKDIVEGTTQIAQEAHEFGLSQPQASTLAAFISQRTNQTGEQSASQLSRVLGSFYNGTFQRTVVKAGVATDAQFASGDIAGVLTNLIEKYHDLAPAQQQMIASLAGTGIQARTFAAMMNIGADGVKAMNGRMKDTGALASLNSRYLLTISGSIKELSEDFQNLGMALQRLGAFDAVEVLAKSLDIVLKILDNMLMVISRLTGNSAFAQFFTHVAVVAAEAAAAFKIFGGSAAAMLGGRGLLAPTAASVAARRAAAAEGVAFAELPPLAYGRVNGRQFIGARRVSQATRLGMTAAEYEAEVAAGTIAAAPRARFLSSAGQSRFWLGSAPQTQTAGMDRWNAATTEGTAAIGEETKVVLDATAAKVEETTAVQGAAVAAGELAAALEGAGVAALGGAGGGGAVAATGEAGTAAAVAGSSRRAAAEARAAAAAAGTRGAGRVVVSGAGDAALVEETAVAGGVGAIPAAGGAGLLARTAARGGVLGGLAGLTRTILPIAAIATVAAGLDSAWRAGGINRDNNANYKQALGTITGAQNPDSDFNAGDAPVLKAPSYGNNLSHLLGGGGTSLASNLRHLPIGIGEGVIDSVTGLGATIANLIPGVNLHGLGLGVQQQAPSDRSENDALAFELKEINKEGLARNGRPNGSKKPLKPGSISDVLDMQDQIDKDFAKDSAKIAKEGNDTKNAAFVLQELQHTHQMITDANARTLQMLELRAGIDAALSPTQIQGLSNFMSGTASLSQSEVQKNSSAIVSALNASSGPAQGTPQYQQALAAAGLRQVVETAPSTQAAYNRLNRQVHPAGSPIGLGGGALPLGVYGTPGQFTVQGMVESLGLMGNTGQAAALQQANENGTLTDWAKANGYTVGGDATSGFTLSGGGGGQNQTGRYVYNPASTMAGRTKQQIGAQQVLIDSNQAILDQSKFVAKYTDADGKVHTNQMITSAQAQAAGTGSDLAAMYAKSKSPTYAPGSAEYTAAQQAIMQNMQTQSQLMDQQQQAAFQAPQGAGSYYASIGGTNGTNGLATQQLGQANNAIQNYMSKNNIKQDDPRYWQYMQQIEQNKQQIAQIENSPEMNAALLAQSSTNDAMSKAAAGSRLALAKLHQDQAGGADSSTIGQDQAAIAAANIAQVQAAQQADAARAGANIAKQRNSVKNLQGQYNETLREENLAANSATADAATYYRLQQQATQELQQLHDAIEAQKEATIEAKAQMDKAAGHEVAAAQDELKKARQAYTYAVQQYGKNSTQALQALGQLATAQAAVLDAQLQAINSRLDSTIAQLQARGQSGDLEKAAQLQITKIRNAMAEFLKKGGKTSDAGYQELQAQLAAAQRNAFDVQLQQQLALLDFQRQTYQITSAQEVQALQQILKNKQLTLAEQQQITLQIKSLQDSIREQLTQGGLNIPSGIVLPTAYDVRRSIGAGFSGSAASQASMGAGNGGATVNNNQKTTVNMNNNVPTPAIAAQIANQVISIINQQTSAQANASTSTPRNVPIK